MNRVTTLSPRALGQERQTHHVHRCENGRKAEHVTPALSVGKPKSDEVGSQHPDHEGQLCHCPERATLRGPLGTMTQLALVIGILGSNVIAF